LSSIEWEGKFEKSGGILADRMSPKFRHLTAKFKPKNVGGITSSLRPNLLVLKTKRKEKSTGPPGPSAANGHFWSRKGHAVHGTRAEKVKKRRTRQKRAGQESGNCIERVGQGTEQDRAG
jgi:hypothetical protein